MLYYVNTLMSITQTNGWVGICTGAQRICAVEVFAHCVGEVLYMYLWMLHPSTLQYWQLQYLVSLITTNGPRLHTSNIKFHDPHLIIEAHIALARTL